MQEFEDLVDEAIASLPDDLRGFMSNVAVVVEDEPPAGLPLLGLYQGVPLTRRSTAYAGVPPRAVGRRRQAALRRLGRERDLLGRGRTSGGQQKERRRPHARCSGFS